MVHVVLSWLTNQVFWGFLNDPAFMSPTDRISNQFLASAIYFAYIGMLAAASAVSYRWRWQTGQHTSHWPVWYRSVASLVRPSTKWIGVFAGIAPPSETKALRVNAFRSGLAARIMIFGAALIGQLFCWSDNSPGAIFIICIAASFFLGLSTFAFDHPRNRHRFWAIRGVHPGQFFYSRLIQSALPCVPLILIGVGLVYGSFLTFAIFSYFDPLTYRGDFREGTMTFVGLRHDVANVLPIMVVCYSTGVLASLCFSNAIAAFAVAFAKLYLVEFSLFMIVVGEMFRIEIGIAPFIVFHVSSGIILLLVSRRITAKWIVQERFSGPSWFVIVIAANIVLSGLLALTVALACHVFMVPR
jgi:hypothetical protein